MKKKLLAIAAGLFVLAPALAADVDGTWDGLIQTPGGQVEVTCEFELDGNALTGTTTGPDGVAVPIVDGKVEGDEISFAAEFDFGGMPMRAEYAGVVTAEEIKLTMNVMGMPMELTVTPRPPATE